MSHLGSLRTYLRDASMPLSHHLGLTKIPEFAHVVVGSFLFFTAIHLLVAPLLSGILFPEAYGKTGKRAKNNWSIHVVSVVHSLIIVFLAGQTLDVPALNQDRAFGWDDRIGLTAGVAAGYFIWDTLDAIINFVDLGFVLHGLSCSLIYTLAFRPFLAYYGNRCLLWEVSTIFLNIHWFLDKTGRTGSTLQLINGIILLSTFFGVRLVYGGKMSIDFFYTLYDAKDKIPFAYVLIYGFGNLVLQTLNWVWFAKMVSALRKRFKSPAPKANGKMTNGNAIPLANGKHD